LILKSLLYILRIINWRYTSWDDISREVRQ